MRLLLLPASTHALHVGGGRSSCSGSGHDDLPLLRDPSGRGRSIQCGVWEQRLQPRGERTCRGVQQFLQFELERVGHQPRFLARVPRIGRGHLRHGWIGRACFHLRSGGCCRPQHCGRRRPDDHAVFLDRRSHVDGKQHIDRGFVVRVEHGLQRPRRRRQPRVDHASDDGRKRVRPNQLPGLSPRCGLRSATVERGV